MDLAQVDFNSPEASDREGVRVSLVEVLASAGLQLLTLHFNTGHLRGRSRHREKSTIRPQQIHLACLEPLSGRPAELVFFNAVVDRSANFIADLDRKDGGEQAVG